MTAETFDKKKTIELRKKHIGYGMYFADLTYGYVQSV